MQEKSYDRHLSQNRRWDSRIKKNVTRSHSQVVAKSKVVIHEVVETL